MFGVGSVAAIGFVTEITGEGSPWSILFTGFFALGLVLVPKPAAISTSHTFCSATLVTAGDPQTLLISVIVLAFLLLLRRDLMLFCSIPPTPARSGSIPGCCITCCWDCCPGGCGGLQTWASFLWSPCWSPPSDGLPADRSIRPHDGAGGALQVLSRFCACSSATGPTAQPPGIVLADPQFLLAFLFAPRHGVLHSHGDLTP